MSTLQARIATEKRPAIPCSIELTPPYYFDHTLQIDHSEITMKELLKLATEIGKASVLDGTINATDLRNNKKQMAVKLAKTAAWTLVQRHPLFIAIKYGAFAAAFVLLIALIGILYFVF
jgi:hypothetical protein